MEYQVNFWRANLTKQIRVGYWRNKSGKLGSPVFVMVGAVKVKGEEFTGYEANAAYNMAERLSRQA